MIARFPDFSGAFRVANGYFLPCFSCLFHVAHFLVRNTEFQHSACCLWILWKFIDDFAEYIPGFSEFSDKDKGLTLPIIGIGQVATFRVAVYVGLKILDRLFVIAL